MEKIGKVLTQRELTRLREILKIEVNKSENKKYYATLRMYIEDLGQISFHEHYISILYFMKYYRTKLDAKIKNKLQKAYDRRILDIEIYKKEVKQKFHKYTKKDFKLFLTKSQYFFSIYKNPFDLKNIKNKDYLNRVYLGLGFEFLLKSIFLKKGYVINKVMKKGLSHPVKSGRIKKKDLEAKTYEFGYFIDLLPKIKPSRIDIREFNYYVVYGLIITQNWRNQDIHTPTGYFSLDNVQSHCIKSTYYMLYKIFLKRVKIPEFPYKIP
ncbi:MAG: hypothetical protein AABX33_04870 [Nanoarchaeota archaeon]